MMRPSRRIATTQLQGENMSHVKANFELPAGTAGLVDHLGIAVRDLDESIALYSGIFGLTLEKVEEIPQENVRVAFLRMDQNSQGTCGHLELLAPMSNEGHIADFIARRGPGLHHLAIAAENLEAVLDNCRRAGLQLIDETPRQGAQGKRIAFLRPQSTGGVLIEICSRNAPE